MTIAVDEEREILDSLLSVEAGAVAEEARADAHGKRRGKRVLDPHLEVGHRQNLALRHLA